ncbi:MAG: hypothetical protein RR620_04020 [Clostridium sp.]
MRFWNLITGKKAKEEKELEQKKLESKLIEKASATINEFKCEYDEFILNEEPVIYCSKEEYQDITSINPLDFQDCEIVVMVRSKGDSVEINKDALKILIKKPNSKLKEYNIPMANFKHFDSTIDGINSEVEEHNGVKATIVYYMEGFGLEMIMLPYGCYDKLTELFPEKNINNEFFKDLDVIRDEMAAYEKRSNEMNHVIA